MLGDLTAGLPFAVAHRLNDYLSAGEVSAALFASFIFDQETELESTQNDSLVLCSSSKVQYGEHGTKRPLKGAIVSIQCNKLRGVSFSQPETARPYFTYAISIIFACARLSSLLTQSAEPLLPRTW